MNISSCEPSQSFFDSIISSLRFIQDQVMLSIYLEPSQDQHPDLQVSALLQSAIS